MSADRFQLTPGLETVNATRPAARETAVAQRHPEAACSQELVAALATHRIAGGCRDSRSGKLLSPTKLQLTTRD
jgi:hypothetical protein